MAEHLARFEAWLVGHGLAAAFATVVRWAVVVTALTLLAIAANWLTRKIVLTAAASVTKRSANKWDDALFKHHVFKRLSHIAPAVVIYFGVGLLEPADVFLRRVAIIYMILVGLAAAIAFLNAVVSIYSLYPVARTHPIQGFVGIGKIVLSIFVGIVVIGMVLNRSPWYLLSGLGAMTAVLILVFKDSILGLVAAIRLSAQDLVAIGDWIEMPKYDADGDVIEVTLHYIKVQNWDKTVVTIPSYALVSESFKNWRGMSLSGGRRIKRSVNIDMTSVRFCDDEMLERFGRIALLKPYLAEKRRELEAQALEHPADPGSELNRRRLTNIGTFRAYVVAYLRSHPKINQQMTFLIRHLQPTDKGLPVEIYVFSNDQVWAHYEAIQADIFDHILAAVPVFDLRIFQQPTGGDVRALAEGLKT